MQFQSTLPGWGATDAVRAANVLYKISIHAPRVGSDPVGSAAFRGAEISIHAPRVGSDCTQFQGHNVLLISIHAPRVGSDSTVMWSIRPDTYFNPRSPGGERPWTMTSTTWVRRFQSTLPGWGATLSSTPSVIPPSHFNPRSPGGERPFKSVGPKYGGYISIHAPRVGSDRENGHLRPRYGQNHPFSTLIVSQIVVDVLGTVRKSQKHQRTSHYEVIKQPERRK